MTVPDLLGLLSRTDVVGVALEDSHRSVDYRDLRAVVLARAGALARDGVAPGDRVAVMVPNSVACVELYLACALLGAIWVGVNPAAPQAERARQCGLVTPAVTIVSGSSSPATRSGRVVELASLFDEGAEPFDGTPPALTTPCAIGFSSGTTGTPKALVHSRAGVSLAAASLAQTTVRSDDRLGVILPMSIHNLMVVGAVAALFAGATCVAVDRMNATGVSAACRERRLTTVSALVPATIYDLVHDDTIAPESLASLRQAGTGAAGLAESLREQFEAKFGVRLVGSYGMTEAPGAVCIEDVGLPHVPGSSGRPLPHVLVAAHDERNRRMPPRQEGELVVAAADRGAWARQFRPAVGTWTAQGLVRSTTVDDSLRTGDHGWVEEDGTVHVSGRRAGVIIRGGVNVNAEELETVLGALPGVREVAVVGEHDDRLGQRIVAFVEPTKDATPDAATLRQLARGSLAHGKVPDEFVIDVLPRNAMGKVVRAQLKYPKP